MLTSKDHAFFHTFLESAVLAPITLGFVDDTTSTTNTGIYSLVLNSAFKESFASKLRILKRRID